MNGVLPTGETFWEPAPSKESNSFIFIIIITIINQLDKLDLISLSLLLAFRLFFLPLLRLCKSHHGLSSTQLTKKNISIPS